MGYSRLQQETAPFQSHWVAVGTTATTGATYDPSAFAAALPAQWTSCTAPRGPSTNNNAHSTAVLAALVAAALRAGLAFACAGCGAWLALRCCCRPARCRAVCSRDVKVRTDTVFALATLATVFEPPVQARMPMPTDTAAATAMHEVETTADNAAGGTPGCGDGDGEEPKSTAKELQELEDLEDFEELLNSPDSEQLRAMLERAKGGEGVTTLRLEKYKKTNPLTPHCFRTGERPEFCGWGQELLAAKDFVEHLVSARGQRALLVCRLVTSLSHRYKQVA
eukprot:COSAG01_NODE_1104_length_11676_cov_61.638853_5_plen_280_part_00